jgi:hypothetical protein
MPPHVGLPFFSCANSLMASRYADIEVPLC